MIAKTIMGVSTIYISYTIGQVKGRPMSKPDIEAVKVKIDRLEGQVDKLYRLTGHYK